MRKVNLLILLILLILPVIYLLLSIMQYNEIGFFHLFSTEPGYAYMLNGLNITQLTSPWMVEHPGTPLEVLAAVTIWISHFFREDPLVTDLMKNPEFYLNAIITVLIILDTLVLFMMGLFIYIYSKDILTSIFFQLTPFIAWIILSFACLIMVEHLVIIFMMCLIIIIFIYLQNKGSDSALIDKYLIWFSILIGLICATKLLYIAVAIIPFILLPTNKKRGIYTILTIVAFAIFACAIFARWVNFRDWFFNNLFHSGQYGRGAATIIEKNSFIYNLRDIFGYKSIFTYAFFLIIASSLLYHIPFLKVKHNNDKYYRALVGIVSFMVIHLLITAKQYKYYYLIPEIILTIPSMYLILKIYSRPFKQYNLKWVSISALVIFVFYVYRTEVRQILIYKQYNIVKREASLKTMNYIKNSFKQDQPTLLIADYYGAPYKEYGLFYGMAWLGGDKKREYATLLKELYPNIYFYHIWNNLFNYWENSYSFIDLLKKYQSIVLYSGDANMQISLNSKMHGVNRQIDTRFKEVYFNDTTKEKIYEVSYDSIAAIKGQKITCDAELLDESKIYFINPLGALFDNGITQSQEKARSGNYSSKLSQNVPYGFTAYISEVKKGEHYKISVWRYINYSGATLVATVSDTKQLYYSQDEAIEKLGEWEKLQIDLLVPENIDNQDVKVYCWNSNINVPAYFDDFSIEKY
jgi:hypothetical protein